jgi:hypothetical protein
MDPHEVATRFGQEVMGWRMAFAGESMLPPGCSFDDGGVSTPSVTHYTCLDPKTGECFAGCPYTWATAVESGSPTGSTEGRYRSFILWPCDPRVCLLVKTQPVEELILYQPLARGPGEIWAVLSVRSPDVQLSATTGQQVREGSTVSATFSGSTEVVSQLIGYASCGASRSNPTESGSQLNVSLPSGCVGPNPGYVWAAEAAPASLPLKDPLVGGETLASLTAVPVTMIFPDQQSDAPPDSALPVSPIPTGSSEGSTKWTPVTDKSGWTMDVPASWDSHSFANTSLTGIGGSGEEFVGNGLIVDVYQTELFIMPADDSTYPLEYDTLLAPAKDGTLAGQFRGDGQPFSIRVTAQSPQLSLEQESIVRHMVGSILFPSLRAGERWQGWTSAGPIDPSETGQWVLYGNAQVFARFKDGKRSVLGPFPPCSSGQGAYGFDTVDGGRLVISIHCPDGDVGRWDFEGDPLPGDPNYFDASIQSSDAMLTWDGQLLIQVEMPGSTPSPEASAAG